MPTKGKVCNFDCIYCECGWNADGRADTVLPSASQVRSLLENKLCECMLNGEKIDSITFSGDGEPTLNPEFPKIVEDTIVLRDAFYPSAEVSVLSNATTLDKPGVFEALCKVDNPIMKLDAVTASAAARINRPYKGYDPISVVGLLEQFHGDFILQTMFLKCKDFDSSSPTLLRSWMDVVRYLHPRKIMVYTVARPVPMEGIEKFTGQQMLSLVQPLIDEGFKIQING